MLMTIKQWSAENNCTPEAALKRIHRGRLPAVKLGRDWLIDSSATFTDRRNRKEKVTIIIDHDPVETA